jgi:hypothetical protein
MQNIVNGSVLSVVEAVFLTEKGKKICIDDISLVEETCTNRRMVP